MNGVNKTLYIPLYGKAYVSKRGIILKDKKAEEIWAAEGFPLKGKAKSKWLAYYMGIRSAVFDGWVKEKLEAFPGAAVIHIGCGMDSRVLRIGDGSHTWFDVDFPDVISERARYYSETDGYKMIVEKTVAAIKNVKLKQEVENIFFVWLQGESDAIHRNTKAYYKEKISMLNEALKKDVSIEKFGIIRVGRFTNDERDFEIISAQNEICRENDNFLMLTDIATEFNKQKKYMNPFVNGHYSAVGLEKLGAEAGESLGNFVIEMAE